MEYIENQIVWWGDSLVSFPKNALHSKGRTMFPDKSKDIAYKLQAMMDSDTRTFQCGVWGAGISQEWVKTVYDKSENGGHWIWQQGWNLLMRNQYQDEAIELTQSQLVNKPKWIFVFLFGTNDISDWKNTKDSYEKSYRRWVGKTPRDGKVILLTVPPYWSKSRGVFTLDNLKNSQIVAEMNPIIKKIGNDIPNVEVIDIYPLLTDRKCYQDLVHLNAHGNQIVANALKPTIKNYIRGVEPVVDDPPPVVSELTQKVILAKLLYYAKRYK